MKKTIMINGEHAIKPFYYLRNGLLHARYTVDRAISLSDWEVDRLKGELRDNGPERKQDIFGKNWNIYENCIEREVIKDGLAEVSNRIKARNSRKEN